MQYTLRLASNNDIKEIEKWLNQQKGETFLCNFDLTKEKYNSNELLIYFDQKLNIPIAYLWLDFGILEVKKTHQKQGIGKKFFYDAIKYIKEKDIYSCLNILCSPKTSIPFWKKMGFIFYNTNNAYFLIDKQLPLPNDGEEIEVIINQYKEEKNYTQSLLPEFENKQKAIKKDNKIYLSKRVIICKERKIWNGDVFIEILINNNLIFNDKAKRHKGKEIGIEDKINSFIINTISL